MALQPKSGLGLLYLLIGGYQINNKEYLKATIDTENIFYLWKEAVVRII